LTFDRPELIIAVIGQSSGGFKKGLRVDGPCEMTTSESSFRSKFSSSVWMNVLTFTTQKKHIMLPRSLGPLFLSLFASSVFGQFLYSPQATIVPYDGGVRIALYADLSIGCPAFSSTLIQEADTLRSQACYFVTGVFNMGGCTRLDTVDLSEEMLNGCFLVVDFNEIGQFTSPAVDTNYVTSSEPFELCTVGYREPRSEQFRIAPNPFVDRIMIHSESYEYVSLEFLDHWGRSVHAERRLLEKGENSIESPVLPTGPIVIRLIANGSTYRRTLIHGLE